MDYSEKQLTSSIDSEKRAMEKPDSSYGRMCQEHFPPTKEWILEPCLKKSDKVKFQCLEITNGQTLVWLNCQTVKLPGESLTLSIGESPSVVVESSLSQILQPVEDVPEKYYLSPRACLGILRRAEARGKALPPTLKEALEKQSMTSA